jgi:hypothetical protein
MFRLGRLIATPDSIQAVSRPALATALRSHARAVPESGKPVETLHGFEGVLFRLRTEPDGTATTMRLEGE